MIALFAIIKNVKSKHAKTLRSVFTKPTPATLAFADIENQLLGLGATLHEREDSRVKFTLGVEKWHAHRPHPGKEAKKYQVESAREFLQRLEIKP